MATAQVILQLQQNVAPQVRSAADAYKQLSSEEQKAERAALQYATAQQRANAVMNSSAVTAQRLAAAEQKTAQATSQAAAASTRAEAAAFRLAQAKDKAASSSGGLAGALTGMAARMVSVTAAIGAAVKVVQSFADAFAFKAELDATTRAIDVQLRGVRDSSAMWQEASHYAEAYKLTQQETTDAVQSSIPILRSSQASVSSVLGTLQRLTVLNPAENIAGAARALRELSAGQITSIVDRFNISRTAANKMKDEIAGGADAIKVLSTYLDSVGIGMDALAAKTTGAAGAMKDVARAEEQLAIAEAEFAQGPGLTILEGKTRALTFLTKVLTGNLSGAATIFEAVGASNNAYNEALLAGKTDTEAAAAAQAAYNAVLEAAAPPTKQNTDRTKDDTVAIDAHAAALKKAADALVEETSKKLDSAIAAKQLADFQKALAVLGGDVAAGLMLASDAAQILHDKYGIAADEALRLVGLQSQISAKPQTDLQKGLSALRTGSIITAEDISDANTRILQQQIQQQQQLEEQQWQNRYKRAQTNAAKIALLRERQAGTSDPVEKARLEGQIIDIQTQKRNTGLDKTLALNERIYDSINKQKDALLDIEELTIRDRQQDRDDAVKRRTAERILASTRASEDMKARARDALALIDVQNRKRAQEIAEKQATAGGQIVQGHLLQSRPGKPGAPGVPVTAAPAGGVIAAPVGAPVVAGGAAGGLTVILQIGAEQVAQAIIPAVVDGMRVGMRGVNSAGGGRSG